MAFFCGLGCRTPRCTYTHLTWLRRGIDAAFNALFLQAAQERFSHRVITAVAPAAHAGDRVVVLATGLRSRRCRTDYHPRYKAGRPARWHSTGWISSACTPTEFSWVCCISWATRFSPHRVRHGLPGVVPAVLYLEYTTHAAQAKLGATLGHECVLHPDTLYVMLCRLMQASKSLEAINESRVSLQ